METTWYSRLKCQYNKKKRKTGLTLVPEAIVEGYLENI